MRLVARLAVTMLALAGPALVGPALAQQTPVWSDIDCSQSHIKAPAGIKCRATQEYAGGTGATSGAGGIFRRWAAFGKIGKATVYYWMGEGLGGQSNFRETRSFDSVVRNTSPEGKDARNFSELKQVPGADYMSFTSVHGERCFGIHVFGPAVGVGHKWILMATRCERRDRDFSADEIARFLAETGYVAS